MFLDKQEPDLIDQDEKDVIVNNASYELSKSEMLVERPPPK